MGTFEGVELVFLPRHGRGHRLGPTDINYRANIDAMKRAGVTEVQTPVKRLPVAVPVMVDVAGRGADLVLHRAGNNRCTACLQNR